MPKNPLKAYLWLIDTLRESPKTLSELQDSYDNSSVDENHKPLKPKTLFNWREKIFDYFHISIKYLDGKYQILEDDESLYQTHKKQSIKSLDWLIQSLAVNTAVSSSHELSRRIMLEDVPSGDNYLRPIIKAMKENRRIWFVYARFNEGIGKEIEAEPYCLKVNNRRWYLICRVPDGNPHHPGYSDFDCYGCIRIYALDRMLECEILDTTFQYPEDFDAEELFRDYVGVCIAYGEPLERVRIRVSDRHRDYLDSLPLHHSQQLVEENDEEAIYEFNLHPTIDFRRTLLSFGIDAEVLSPEWLRDWMADQSASLDLLYNPTDSDQL